MSILTRIISSARIVLLPTVISVPTKIPKMKRHWPRQSIRGSYLSIGQWMGRRCERCAALVNLPQRHGLRSCTGYWTTRAGAWASLQENLHCNDLSLGHLYGWIPQRGRESTGQSSCTTLNLFNSPFYRTSVVQWLAHWRSNPLLRVGEWVRFPCSNRFSYIQ